jgi:hypothetical protein
MSANLEKGCARNRVRDSGDAVPFGSQVQVDSYAASKSDAKYLSYVISRLG